MTFCLFLIPLSEHGAGVKNDLTLLSSPAGIHNTAYSPIYFKNSGESGMRSTIKVAGVRY